MNDSLDDVLLKPLFLSSYLLALKLLFNVCSLGAICNKQRTLAASGTIQEQRGHLRRV